MEPLPASSDSVLRYFDIAWLSRYDGPGYRVVLYLQGCPLRCPWCHSPHSQPTDFPLLYFPARCRHCGSCARACPHGAHEVTAGVHILHRDRCTGCGQCIGACPVSHPGRADGALAQPGNEETVAGLWHTLYPQLDLLRGIGGLTASGGEALLQWEALAVLLGLCKKEGIHTAVETSGVLPRKHLEDVAPVTDCWLYGLRPTPAYTPPLADRITANLAYLVETGSRIIIRTPVIAGITDSPASLEHIARTMQANGLQEIQLLPFNRETAHYYQALGRECTVGSEANVTPERMEQVRAYFQEKDFSATIIQ